MQMAVEHVLSDCDGHGVCDWGFVLEQASRECLLSRWCVGAWHGI